MIQTRTFEVAVRVERQLSHDCERIRFELYARFRITPAMAELVMIEEQLDTAVYAMSGFRCDEVRPGRYKAEWSCSASPAAVDRHKSGVSSDERQGS